MATNRQESSTDQPGPYTFCWGRAVHDDRFYLPRRGEEQLLSALRAGQFCTAFASPMCGLTSLGFRLGRRLKAEGVQVAYINSLYFGQAGHTEEMVYNTFADLVSQELDLPEEDLAQEDHPLRGHSYSCPVRVEFNAACRCKLGEPERLRCFLEAIAERGPLSWPSTDAQCCLMGQVGARKGRWRLARGQNGRLRWAPCRKWGCIEPSTGAAPVTSS